MLMLCTSAFNYGQETVIHDFETGSPAIAAVFNSTFSLIANPDTSDNASANVGRIGRTAGTNNWWLAINFELATPYNIPAGETHYLHALVLAPAQPDLGVRVDGTAANNFAGGTTRGSNTYTDIGKWQDIVFAIAGGAGGKTVSYLSFQPDMITNNVPSGIILNDTDSFLLIDNIKFTNSATSELQNTWLGTTADWSTQTNWSRGLPSSSLGIIIPAGVTEPVVADNTAIETNYMNIASGTAINIGNGSSLIVDKESISPNNSIKYSRTLTANSDPTKAWHLAASPIAGVSIVNFIAGNTLASGTTNTNFRGIGNYTNDGNGFNYYEFDYAGTDAFNVAKGFAIKNAAAGTVEFSGFFRKSDREISINQGTDNFNLVGNAFLAYMNLGTFFTDNNAADRLSEATIWLWDPSANAGNGGYITKMSGTDAAFEVAPGQAFFVSSGAAASNVVSFLEANQSHKTDTFLKNANSRTEVELKISQDNLITSTKLYYIEGTTTGFDNGFDGSLFDGVSSDLSIYTGLMNQDKKLSIQSLPNLDYDAMVIPIGLKAVSGKEITISANSLNLPDGINVYLEDRLNNTFTNLNETSFKINLKESLDGTGRFFLKTTAKALSTVSTELSGVQVFNRNNNILTVRGLQPGKAAISMFNTLGKQVLSSSFTSNNNIEIALPKLASGIYIVNLETEKGTLNKKIILE